MTKEFFMMVSSWSGINKIFKDILILRCEFHFSQTINYEGLSRHFDEVPEGEVMPEKLYTFVAEGSHDNIQEETFSFTVTLIVV